MKKRRQGKYILCVLLVAALITAAFWMPDLAMRFLDEQAQNNIVFRSRTGIAPDAVNTEYEMDLSARLGAFSRSVANGGEYYVIRAQEGEKLTEEQEKEIRARIMEQDLYWYLTTASLGDDSKLSNLWDYEFVRSDYYVIYDGNAASGGTILCWDLELEYGDAKLRFVVDAKDYTIYYGEGCSDYISALRMMLFYEKVTALDMSDVFWELAEYYGAWGDVSEKVVMILARYYEISPDSSQILDEEEHRLVPVHTFAQDGEKFYGPVSYGDSELTLILEIAEDGQTGMDELQIGIQEMRDLLSQ